MATISQDTILVELRIADKTSAGFGKFESGINKAVNSSDKLTNSLNQAVNSSINKDIGQAGESFNSASEDIDKFDEAVGKIDETLSKTRGRFERTTAVLGNLSTIVSESAELAFSLARNWETVLAAFSIGSVGLQKFLGVFGLHNKAVDGAVKRLGLFGIAVGVLRNPLFLAASTLTFFSAASAAFARDLTIATERTTVATDELQKFDFQLSQLSAGADLDDLQEFLLNLSERFGEATRDAGAIRDALQAVGLSQDQIVSLNFQGPEAQLQAIRESFQNIATDSERIFRARELFAEDGLRTLQFIIAEQEELDRLAKRSVDLGLVVPEFVLDDLNELTKEYKVFGQVAENTSIELGSVFARISTESFGLINDLIGLIGGPRGLGAALRALTFPIVKPLELGIKSARFLVGIYNNLASVISQRLVGALRSAADTTRNWLEEVGQNSGFRDWAFDVNARLARVNLRTRIAAANFQLLNESLPDTEVQRLTDLIFTLEQAIAGSDDQARNLRDSLADAGDESEAVSQQVAELINNLAGIDSEVRDVLTVDSTELDKVAEFQNRIDIIRGSLQEEGLTILERDELTRSLEVAESSLNEYRQREIQALDERRKDFESNFNDIAKIERDALRQRQELNELFSGSLSEGEKSRFNAALSAINAQEQAEKDSIDKRISDAKAADDRRDQLQKDRAAKEAQRLADQQKREEDRAKAEAKRLADQLRREKESAASNLTTLQESFNERLKISNDAQKQLNSLENIRRTVGIDPQVESGLVNSIIAEEKRQLDELDRARAEEFLARRERRDSVLDLSSLVNFDGTGIQSIEKGADDIARIFRERVKAINLSVDLTSEEKLNAIREAALLREDLKKELTIDVAINRVESGLQNTGQLFGALGTIQQSGTQDDAQQAQERSNQIQQVQADLNAAIEAGNQAEVQSQQNKLNQLNALQAREQQIAKKRFENYKKTQKAIAIVSTISAATQVFQETKGDLFARVAGMAAALAAGYAQVRAIDRQQFSSGSISNSGASASGGSNSGISNDQVTSSQNQNVNTTSRRSVQNIVVSGFQISVDQLEEIAKGLNENAADGGTEIRVVRAA